jgi:hypothetical protein
LAVEELLLVTVVIAVEDVSRRVESTDPTGVGLRAVQRPRHIAPVAILPFAAERLPRTSAAMWRIGFQQRSSR